MKKSLLFLSACIVLIQASDIKDKEEKMLDSSDIVIKYMNFQPKEVDEACLNIKVKKLLTVIIKAENAKKLSSEIPLKEYFLEKNKKLIDKIKKAQSQLLMRKHISYKGNHEWNNITASKYLLLESKKNHMYVMYPLEPMTFIILDKPYEDIMASKEYENINARELKNWIDMKKCFNKGAE